MCCFLSHLDNCKYFGVFNIFKNIGKVEILSNDSCNCSAPCEFLQQFIFDCDKYTDNKGILFDNLNWLTFMVL
jgi:hypothetical protein